MRYITTFVICAILKQSAAQELLLVPNSSINGFSFNPAYTFHHTPRFAGVTHHFQSGISNGIQSNQVTAGTPIYKNALFFGFSGLADRIGTTNQTLNLNASIAYRLRINQALNFYMGLTYGKENQKRFLPDYIDRYNYLQPSLNYWNIPDSLEQLQSTFTVLHQYFGVAGPKLFFGIQNRNWNRPLDAANNRVNKRWDVMASYEICTRLGRFTPLLMYSYPFSSEYENPFIARTAAFFLNYHYLKFISGIGIRNTKYPSYHLQLGYEFKRLTVLYNLGVSPVNAPTVSSNASTFHQISLQVNLSSRNSGAACYIREESVGTNGLLKTVKLYDDDQLEVWEEYHENGELMEEKSYENGLLDGEYFYSNESGDTTISGRYKQGKKQGRWIEEEDSENDAINRTVVFHYEGDLLHGKYVLKEERKRITGHYMKGKKSGEWVEYNGDGRRLRADQIRSTYVNDLLHGSYQKRENRKVVLSGQYIQGMRDGEWLYYDENGKHFKTEKYTGGALIECIYP
jgi:antitoxin component YwqK of YwqJK toxin-antitoxin module